MIVCYYTDDAITLQKKSKRDSINETDSEAKTEFIGIILNILLRTQALILKVSITL